MFTENGVLHSKEIMIGESDAFMYYGHRVVKQWLGAVGRNHTHEASN